MEHRQFRRRPGRVAIATSAFAVTAIALAGCAGGGTEVAADGGGLGTQGAPIDLKVLVNDAYASQWQEKLVPEFNKDFPNIKVTIDGVPYNDQLAKTMLELTNTTPTYDVVMADDNWTPQMASTGGLFDLKSAPLNQWTDKDYDWADFYPAALAAGQHDGKQYAVPARSNVLMMLYNKTLYQKAGVPEPTPGLTWEQYLEQAPKLVQDTNGDGKKDAWTVGTYFVRDGLTPTIWQTIMNSNGAHILDQNGKAALGPEAVKALETHKKLLDFAPPGAVGWQFNEPLEAFRQGRIATLITWGSVYRGSAVDPKTTTLKPEEVGIQTLPAGSAGPGAHRGVWSMGVNARTEKPKAAWTFAQWLTSKKGEKWQTDTLGVFPARTSTLEAAPAEEWLKPIYAALKVAWPAIDKGQMWRPHIVESDAVQQALATETGEFIPGKEAAQAAVDRMNAGIAKVLK